MKLSIIGVIVGVYWYCCRFQSSICGEQSLLVPIWIQPFVCLPEEGKGTRQPLWFTIGPGPARLWPHSKLVIALTRSTSLSLSFPLSSFSLALLPLSVPRSLQTQFRFSTHGFVFTLFLLQFLCFFPSFFLSFISLYPYNFLSTCFQNVQ